MTETHTPLPCPFCSGAAEVESESCGWRVICQNPECATHGPWPTDCTEAEALTAWNTRADSHHRLVEALEVMRGYGCPVCNGDCGSANPPVMACPMLMIDAAIKEACHDR